MSSSISLFSNLHFLISLSFYFYTLLTVYCEKTLWSNMYLIDTILVRNRTISRTLCVDPPPIPLQTLSGSSCLWTPRVGYLQALQRSSQIMIRYVMCVVKWEKHTFTCSLDPNLYWSLNRPVIIICRSFVFEDQLFPFWLRLYASILSLLTEIVCLHFVKDQLFQF